MTVPEDETRKTVQEILETVVGILSDYLAEQTDTTDALLPLL